MWMRPSWVLSTRERRLSGRQPPTIVLYCNTTYRYCKFAIHRNLLVPCTRYLIAEKRNSRFHQLGASPFVTLPARGGHPVPRSCGAVQQEKGRSRPRLMTRSSWSTKRLHLPSQLQNKRLHPCLMTMRQNRRMAQGGLMPSSPTLMSCKPKRKLGSGP